MGGYLRTEGFNRSVDHVVRSRSDIGLVGLFNSNYGNCLTYYALYSVLRSKGKSVTLIGSRGPLSFKAFSRMPYPLSDLYYDPEDEGNVACNDLCDVFVLGSDQWLRPNILVRRDYYPLMHWVEDSKPKIGYAVSFGVDRFTSDRGVRIRTGTYLSRFDSVSCREDSGTRIMRDVFGMDCAHVLDPVFLPEPGFYEQLCKGFDARVPGSPYVFSYILDPTAKRMKFVSDAKERLGLAESVNVYDALIKRAKVPEELIGLATWSATVEEWLSFISKSDFFITDSFHGACFAIIMKKQFAVIYESWQWRGQTRLDSLLKMFGLEDRMIDIGDSQKVEKVLGTRIDYKKVDKLVSKERKRSLGWLDKALEQAGSGPHMYNGFGYLEGRIDELMARCADLQSEIDALKASHAYPVLPVGRKIDLEDAKDLGSYLNALRADPGDIVIMMSVTDDASRGWSMARFPEDICPEIPEELPYRSGFAYISDPGSGRCVSDAEGHTKVSYSLGGIALVCESQGFVDIHNHGFSEFTANGSTLRAEGRGLNIAVYSKSERAFVDLVSVDLFAKSTEIVRKKD